MDKTFLKTFLFAYNATTNNNNLFTSFSLLNLTLSNSIGRQSKQECLAYNDEQSGILVNMDFCFKKLRTDPAHYCLCGGCLYKSQKVEKK